MAKSYDLVPVLEGKQYQIRDYDAVLEACKSFVEETLLELNLDGDIKDLRYKDVKEARTTIRKKLEQVKRVRIDCGELALAVFNEQTKTLEKALSDIDNNLKEVIDKYDSEVLGKLPKPPKITLTIKGYNSEKIELIKAYALELGEVEITIK